MLKHWDTPITAILCPRDTCSKILTVPSWLVGWFFRLFWPRTTESVIQSLCYFSFSHRLWTTDLGIHWAYGEILFDLQCFVYFCFFLLSNCLACQHFTYGIFQIDFFILASSSGGFRLPTSIENGKIWQCGLGLPTDVITRAQKQLPWGCVLPTSPWSPPGLPHFCPLLKKPARHLDVDSCSSLFSFPRQIGL